MRKTALVAKLLIDSGWSIDGDPEAFVLRSFYATKGRNQVNEWNTDVSPAAQQAFLEAYRGIQQIRWDAMFDALR